MSNVAVNLLAVVLSEVTVADSIPKDSKLGLSARYMMIVTKSTMARPAVATARKRQRKVVVGR